MNHAIITAAAKAIADSIADRLAPHADPNNDDAALAVIRFVLSSSSTGSSSPDSDRACRAFSADPATVVAHGRGAPKRPSRTSSRPARCLGSSGSTADHPQGTRTAQDAADRDRVRCRPDREEPDLRRRRRARLDVRQRGQPTRRGQAGGRRRRGAVFAGRRRRRAGRDRVPDRWRAPVRPHRTASGVRRPRPAGLRRGLGRRGDLANVFPLSPAGTRGGQRRRNGRPSAVTPEPSVLLLEPAAASRRPPAAPRRSPRTADCAMGTRIRS